MHLPNVKQAKQFIRSATARLALSYLAIIMLMSVGFSVVLYNASARTLHPHGPWPTTSQHGSSAPQPFVNDRPRIERDPAVEAYLRQRETEGKQSLLERLLVLNLIALAGGSALSYYLARRTLQPIEENMDAQVQFVSDASHELRTPLTALQTTNEVALRKPKLTEAEARDLLEHNVSEVAKLQGLTAALLRLAKPDDTTHVRVPTSLQAAATEAMNSFIPAAQAKHIAVQETVPDTKVLGDISSLAQILGILLDNAIKYSPEGGTITLTGGKTAKLGFVSVQDQGMGIAAKDLSHIFDRFYRIDQSRTTKQGKVDGYGIGLSLAKKLLHQIGGEISVSSTEGRGSTFTVRLPLA